MPSCVLLPHRETRDSHILRDIIDHESDEPHVRRQRNHQRRQNEQVQAPRCRLNYRWARMETRKEEKKRTQASTPHTFIVREQEEEERKQWQKSDR